MLWKILQVEYQQKDSSIIKKDTDFKLEKSVSYQLIAQILQLLTIHAVIEVFRKSSEYFIETARRREIWVKSKDRTGMKNNMSPEVSRKKLRSVN